MTTTATTPKRRPLIRVLNFDRAYLRGIQVCAIGDPGEANLMELYPADGGGYELVFYSMFRGDEFWPRKIAVAYAEGERYFTTDGYVDRPQSHPEVEGVERRNFACLYFTPPPMGVGPMVMFDQDRPCKVLVEPTSLFETQDCQDMMTCAVLQQLVHDTHDPENRKLYAGMLEQVCDRLNARLDTLKERHEH